MDSKRNVIVNVHVEAANINDVTPMPRNTRRDRSKAGHAAQIHGTGRGIPQRMDSASAGDERDTRGDRVPAAHAHAALDCYRFRYDPDRDEYICPEKQRLTWKTTTREGYRQYCCEGKTCKGCPRRAECFGASMNRRWWSGMCGRGRWRGSMPLRKRIVASVFMDGGKRRSNDPSRRPRRTMACAVRACLEYGTCGSSVS